MNGHDLNRGRIGLGDGLWTVFPKCTNVHQTTMDGGDVMTRFRSDAVHHRHPCFCKLSLGIVRISNEQVGTVEDGIKDIVEGTPLSHLLQVFEKVSNGCGGCMGHKGRPHRFTNGKLRQHLVNLCLGQPHQRRPGDVKGSPTHRGFGHQGQHRHQGLNNGLVEQQALAVGHHGDVSAS